MKNKKRLYAALLAVGLCLVAAAFLLRNSGLPYGAGAALMGGATTLSCIAVPRLLAIWSEETSPSEARRNKIERSDERNVAMRNRARALSGEVLQWVLVAAAWIAVGFGAPLWVLLLAFGAVVLKGVLELCLLLRYQREM